MELITPPTKDGLVLEGIVRESCLEIVKEWNEFNVGIRYPTINEIKEAINDGRVILSVFIFS